MNKKFLKMNIYLFIRLKILRTYKEQNKIFF